MVLLGLRSALLRKVDRLVCGWHCYFDNMREIMFPRNWLCAPLASNIMPLFYIPTFREKREEIARIKDELRSKGMEVLPEKKAEEHFDSNCITPVCYYFSLRNN